MTPEEIKTLPTIKLKANPYLIDPQKAFLYQRRGILMMLTTPRMVLGDDVGLGKTLMAIYAFTYLKAARPETKALVLTEKSSIRQWGDELRDLTTGLKIKTITRETHPDPTNRSRAFREHDADVLVTGYSMIYKYGQYIREGLKSRWVLIADEPNVFKNTHTHLHRSIFNLTNHPDTGAVRAYGLTATILENALEEVFGIMRVVAPGTFVSRHQFEEDFCIMKHVPNQPHYVKYVTGYRNLKKFRETIRPVFYARLQTDPEVKQVLPKVLPKNIKITLSKKQSEKVREAMDHVLELPSGTTVQLDLLTALTRAQQLVNDPRLLGFDIESAKLEALLEMLQGSLKAERTIVFCKFRSMIDQVDKELTKRHIPFLRITGKEKKQTERDRARERFMSDGPDRCNILLMNRAGQKALNLQKGGHLIFFDVPWSYGLYRQTVGRLKRTGSNHKMIGVYHFLATLHPDVAKSGGEETIDHYTLEVVKDKQELWSAVTGNQETIDDLAQTTQAIFKMIKESRTSPSLS